MDENKKFVQIKFDPDNTDMRERYIYRVLDISKN